MKNKRTIRGVEVKSGSQAIDHKNSSEVYIWPIHVCDDKTMVVCNSIHHGEIFYVPDHLHRELEDEDSFITMENFPDEFYICSEMLFDELIKELKMQILDIKIYKNNLNFNSIEKLSRINSWICLLTKTTELLSGRELLALNYCVSTHASESNFNERKKMIRRSLLLIQKELKSNKIDIERFSEKIDAFDSVELYELTEILLSSKIIDIVIWDYQSLSGSSAPNKSLNRLHEELSVLKIDESWKEIMIKKQKDFWKDKYDKVPSIILDYIKKVPKFKRGIDEFEDVQTYYDFFICLEIILERSLLNYKSAKEFMDFESKLCHKRFFNIQDDDFYRRRLKVKSLISDYVSCESMKMKNRAVGYYSDGVRFNEKIHKFAFKHDYSLICPDDTFTSFESNIFDKQNYDLILYYYVKYLHVFPIEINEFEKTLFSFLLYLVFETIPGDLTDINNLICVKNELNTTLKSKYICIDDDFILIFLHFLNNHPDLKQMRDESYKEFHDRLGFSHKE